MNRGICYLGSSGAWANEGRQVMLFFLFITCSAVSSQCGPGHAHCKAEVSHASGWRDLLSCLDRHGPLDIFIVVFLEFLQLHIHQQTLG